MVWYWLAGNVAVLINKPQSAPCPVVLLSQCCFDVAWFISPPAGFPADLVSLTLILFWLSWKVVSSSIFCWDYTVPLTAHSVQEQVQINVKGYKRRRTNSVLLMHTHLKLDNTAFFYSLFCLKKVSLRHFCHKNLNIHTLMIKLF